MTFRKRQRTLVIMAKAPRPGMVKTRLTRSLPAAVVPALYRCLLEDTLTLALSLQDVNVAIMCPPLDREDLETISGRRVSVFAQSGEGLAAALVSVFAQFAASGEQKVIAFNSDSPHLPASVLHSAFDALEQCDVVVGPTHDGGYYLVGSKANHAQLFHADGMGHSSALERLLAQIAALGLSVHMLGDFYDIDVADDLIRLTEELCAAPDRASHTAAWLAERAHLLASIQISESL